jgi:adenylylsulfate kinase
MTANEHLYPEFDRMLPRDQREQALGQRGHVIWLSGLSGSGKSTLAIALEQKLHQAGRVTTLLDGDNIRTGLNRDLGFSNADRAENIRRIAEVAKLFAQSGIITLASFITPLEVLRAAALDIIGRDDLTQIYVRCSYARCAERDPKGLYAKVKAGQVAQFTGKDSGFEEPVAPDVIIDTENTPLPESLEQLYQAITGKITLRS